MLYLNDNQCEGKSLNPMQVVLNIIRLFRRQVLVYENGAKGQIKNKVYHFGANC